MNKNRKGIFKLGSNYPTEFIKKSVKEHREESIGSNHVRTLKAGGSGAFLKQLSSDAPSAAKRRQTADRGTEQNNFNWR